MLQKIAHHAPVSKGIYEVLQQITDGRIPLRMLIILRKTAKK
jgi:hypothetical protein